MQDPQDYDTADLPLDTTEQPEAPPAQAPAKPKTFRSKYTEAFMLKCRANRDPNGPDQMLLTALVGCDVPHKSVDAAFNLPEGTVQKYLLSGKAVPINELASFDDDAAMMVFDMLSDLHSAAAFKGSDLKIAGVLQAMLAFKLRVDE